MRVLTGLRMAQFMLLTLGIGLFLSACGGGEESEFTETRPVAAEKQGSGESPNKTSAVLNLVDGVKQWDGPPQNFVGGLLITYQEEYRATIEMETIGGQPADGKRIVIDLWFSNFPRYLKNNVTRTVNNFIFLAREGFFDGHTFSLDPERLIRTGDPPGPLTGAGYVFDNEKTIEFLHDRQGVVSMWNEGIASSPPPGWTPTFLAQTGTHTNSSQWFIALTALPDFDYYDEELRERDCTLSDISCHTPFGFVIEGMDVVKNIFDGDRIKTVTIEKLPDGGSKAFLDRNLILGTPDTTSSADSTGATGQGSQGATVDESAECEEHRKTKARSLGGEGGNITLDAICRAHELRQILNGYFGALNAYDVDGVLPLLEEGYRSEHEAKIRTQVDELKTSLRARPDRGQWPW